jgi:hypothetical protein
VLLVAALIIGVVLRARNTEPSPNHSETSPTAFPSTPTTLDPFYDVTYEVDGDICCASITYENSTGGSAQADIDVPLTTTDGVTGMKLRVMRGAFLYISAQNTSGRSGSITCRIKVNGLTVKETTSQGRSVIASCSGRL